MSTYCRGETVLKVSVACRKIDLKIETRGQCIELSHTECAQAPIPAKIVRDRSKILHTNKCILDNYLRLNIPDKAVEDSAVYAIQFAGNMCFVFISMNCVGNFYGYSLLPNILLLC